MKCSTIHLCICFAVLARRGIAEGIEDRADELAPMGEAYAGMISQPTAMLEVMVLDQLQSNESENDLGPKKGNDAFIKKVAAMTKGLKDGIKKAKKREQGLLDDTIKAFNSCVKFMSKVSLAISEGQGKIKALFMDSRKCSQKIRPMYAKVLRCPKVVNAKKDGVKKENQLVKIMGKRKFVPKTCKKQAGEGHLLWLKRMVNLVENRKKQLDNRGLRLDKHGVKLVKERRRCKKLILLYNRNRKVCVKKQTKLKARQCKLVGAIDLGCSGYKSCYNEAVKTFLATVKKAKVLETHIKLEWRALERIECYLKPFGNAKNNKKANLKALEACNKKKKYNTDHLDLKYHKMPKITKCPKIVGKVDCPGLEKMLKK